MAADSGKSETAKREEAILAFWNEQEIFEESVRREPRSGKEYTFYDGPPFATGLPHYGHILASAIKDAIPRYYTMKGFRVKRQWGWDCHGLPIENIVEKELGTKTKKDILALGVKKFNDLCRERIFTYITDWERIIPRLGRWADMAHPYRTMDTSYMESDWWAFKTLYEKGLIYEDYRVMYICPRCETTLSQSEVADGYKDVKDLTATVMFELDDEPGTYLLAWTTTPWTLPGNVALAVGIDIEYVRVHASRALPPAIKALGIETPPGQKLERLQFILSKAAFDSQRYRRTFEDVFVVQSVSEPFLGSELLGKKYKPPFQYYRQNGSLKDRENGWKVYAADFVTTDEGTGIVHVAPAFGEDDYELGKAHALPFVQHVGMDGIFAKDVTDFAGLHVKPIEDESATDVEIIKYLAHHGTLFAKEKHEHSYPHCWRCDTPLINYATSSWFVNVTSLKPALRAYAEGINWSPAHIKDGRWGQWLLGARDWSISRQRFWATTMPVWRCEQCRTDRIMGSIGELEAASGQAVHDLHKDVVDEIVIPCECGGTMRRIPDVLDTWFDSGSVPYASLHYPFENEEEFRTRLPADFIAEGQDQTRTWFYYQHVLAGALFESRAFSNVIVNGLVLAEDGKKMSKRLNNYPDPMLLVDRYGADSLRLYMLASQAVEADNLAFAESGVDEWHKKAILRLENTMALLALYGDGAKDARDDSAHVLDRWIIARLRELAQEMTAGLDAYALNAALRPFLPFVDDLSTWYVRRSRDRLKDMETDDGKAARATLRYVLRTLAQLMAPFAPFAADSLWLRLRTDADAASVHLAEWPALGSDIDTQLLGDMARARAIVTLALDARDSAGIKVRQPLAALSIGSALGEELRAVIAEEVNVEAVRVDSALGEFVALDTEITPALEEKGRARELIRMIQDARKAQGFAVLADAAVLVHGPAEWQAVVASQGAAISAATRAASLAYAPAETLSVEVAAPAA
ncbi:MAG TPA: isoleucine--tRNA ligase [Candidatus Paceibacterota bacterium]|nr:isoleucine--tRNA ligase [Candidatus Paceibacterota bacterium]